ERIHLEWRLDPTSAHRIAEATPDRRVVVVCNEGYASSLAAATLRDLGVSRATDLDGGYRAWRAARARFGAGPARERRAGIVDRNASAIHAAQASSVQPRSATSASNVSKLTTVHAMSVAVVTVRSARSAPSSSSCRTPFAIPW